MRAIMALSALTLVLAAAPTDLRAQPRILELGLGVGHSGTQIYQGQQRTNVGGLAASFRAAWHLTNTLAIEPGLAVTSYDAAGAGILSLGPELGLPYTFGSVYSQQAFYLRPAVGADVLLGNDAAGKSSSAEA